MGDRAVLVEDPPGGPAAWSRGLRLANPPWLVDAVPAARTVLVRWSGEERPASLVDRLHDVRPVLDDRGAPEITIPVRYDGPDLDAVARAAGLSVEAVVALHVDAAYQVAFCGFAPGVAYLTGLPEPLHLPRRATPRARVPPGAVAIAAEYAAVYPAASPGGWHLLGATDLVMFDPDRDPPALLAPGARVRFVPT